MQDLSQFYLSQAEPNKSCLLTLRDLILKLDTDVSETRKYGMPCFCYKQKMFCYLWNDKKTKEPYVLFVEGNRLEHPQLETGSRSRMKILRISPTDDLPIATLNLLLNQALDLYRKGVIPIK